MPRATLQALALDIDRLLSAGASSAPGDAALISRAARLRAIGAKIPAMAAIREAADRVVDSQPDHAARPLLNLVAIVSQARAALTIPGMGCEGPLEPIAPSGPWESAALPAFGPSISPGLRARFHLKGNAADGRILAAICPIDPLSARETCLRALREGGAHVRLAAFQNLPAVAPESVEGEALAVLRGRHDRTEEDAEAVQEVRRRRLANTPNARTPRPSRAAEAGSGTAVRVRLRPMTTSGSFPPLWRYTSNSAAPAMTVP